MRLADIYTQKTRPGPDRVEQIKLFIKAQLEAPGYTGAPLFAVPFGDNLYTFPPTPRDEKGKSKVDFIGWEPSLRAKLVALGLLEDGSLPVSKVVHGFSIPSSVILVTGKGNVGKTPFAHGLADLIAGDDADGFGLLRYGEPFVGYLKTEEQAGNDLARYMAVHRSIVIDSVKDLLTDMSGQAMESGLARRSVSMLSRLAMVASEIGCSVIIPVNPSSSKDTIGDLIAEIARSNVGMAAINSSGTWKLISREGEGRLRVEGQASITYKDGVPAVDLHAVVSDSENDPVEQVVSAFESSGNNNINDLLGVARRLANN